MWYNSITGNCIGETEEEAREMMKQEMSARDYLKYFQNNQDLMEKIVLVALNQGLFLKIYVKKSPPPKMIFLKNMRFMMRTMTMSS